MLRFHRTALPPVPQSQAKAYADRLSDPWANFLVACVLLGIVALIAFFAHVWWMFAVSVVTITIAYLRWSAACVRERQFFVEHALLDAGRAHRGVLTDADLALLAGVTMDESRDLLAYGVHAGLVYPGDNGTNVTYTFYALPHGALIRSVLHPRKRERLVS